MNRKDKKEQGKELDYEGVKEVLFNAILRGTIYKLDNENYQVESSDYSLEYPKNVIEVVSNELGETISGIMMELLKKEDELNNMEDIVSLFAIMQPAMLEIFEEFSLKEIVDKTLEVIKYLRGESIVADIDFFEGFTEYYNGTIDTINKEKDKEEKRYRINALQEYVNKLLDRGVIDATELEKAKYFDTLSDGQLIKLYKEGFIPEDKLFESLAREKLKEDSEADPYLYVAKQYRNAKKRNSKRGKEYLSIFSPSKACAMYAKGIFDKEDIEKFEVTKDLVKVLDEDTFLGMAKQGFPKEISFKSSEIVQEYLERYSGATLIELAKLGYVNPEELIQLTEYQSNLLYDETLKVDNKKLLELYTPELMAILISQERIDGKSLSIYRHNLLSMLNEEEQIELLGMVSKELHKTYKEEQQYIEKMLSLHEMGFIPKDVIENMNPSQHAIEELYLNEGLSLEDIVKLFNSSIIDEQVLKGIFSFDEIIEMVNSGELNERAIFSMGKKDLNNTLKQNLVAGKLEIRSILNLYVNYDGISIEDFNSIYRDTNQLEELLNLLPDNCNKQKIKELYVNYLISHSDLLELKNRGIITEEDFKEFSKELGKAEFYSMFSNGSSVYNCSEKLEEGSQKGMQVMGQNISACESAYKITAESRKKLFEEMGAHKNFIEMEELSDDDKEVPFKGYSIIGFPDFELVVLENFEKWNNATYIMAYQQFAYYINNSQKTKKVFEGSKKTLRESSMLGEAVRVRIHTKNWGALVIDSMCELSEDARKQLKPEQECTSKIDDLVKAIAKDFER